MQIAAHAAATRAPIRRGPPTFVTDDTHWWDGSQIYGRDPAFAHALRSGEHGKLRIDEHGLPPQRPRGARRPHRRRRATSGSASRSCTRSSCASTTPICDHLHATHPELSDDELYDKARLVVAALMAKIHTIDWTPAIIAHPTTVTALRTNWWGLEGERLDKLHRPAHVERGDPRHPRLADRTTTASRTRSPRSSSASTACTR